MSEQVIRRTEQGLNNADELVQQWMSTQGIVTDASLTGANGGQTWSGITNPQIGNEGLDRGEVAELVAVDVHGGQLGLQQQDMQGTTPGSVQAEIHCNLDTFDTNEEFDETLDDGNGNTATMRIRSRTNNGYVFYTRTSTQTAFNDTVNATGGSATDGTFPAFFKDYRGTFGTGPLVWWDGDKRGLEVQTQIKAYEIDTEGIQYKHAATLYWDIHKLDEMERTINDVVGNP